MLSRPFLALYVSVFVAVMGISMVSPLLPVYAEELGANGIWLGLTFSAFAITQAIFAPIVGKLSDRYARKPFIVVGLLIYMCAAIGYLTAGNFYQVIAFRAFSGIGTSLIFSVARAYVGDLTPPGQEGKWFGVFATADVLGFGTGPLLAGVMRETLGFESVFIAMAAMLGSSALFILFSLPNVQQRHESRWHNEPVMAMSFRAAMSDKLVMALTIHSTLISLAVGSSMSFLGLRLEDSLHASPTLIGLAFSTQDLTGGLAQPFFGRMADSRDRRRLVAIGLCALGAALFALGLATQYWQVVLLLLAMGAANGLAAVSASAILVVAGRRVGMGTMLGLWSTGNGIGILIGSLVSGVLVTLLNIETAFFFGGIVVASGATVFLVLTKGLTTREESMGPPAGELREAPAAST